MKRLLAILLALAMMFAFAACSTESPVDDADEPADDAADASADDAAEEEADNAAKEDYLFGLIVPETESESIQLTLTTIPNQLAELGYGEDQVMVGSYQNDATQIASVVENFDVAGVDCVLLNPYTEADAESASQLLEQYGIKNVLVGLKASTYDVFLTLDQVAYGADLTTLATAWIKETYGDEKVEVAILNMSQTLNVYERSFGIREELEANCPNAEVVADIDASNTEDSIAATENIITMYPDVKAIICVKDDFAIGAIEAFKGAGKVGDEYAIFGMDFNQQVGNELLKEDSIYRGSAFIDGTQINCGEIMLQAAKGELEKGTDVVYPTALVTSENAADALAVHGYEVTE